MGHQYGGYHVMNTCSRSGNGTTEVEPASEAQLWVMRVFVLQMYKVIVMMILTTLIFVI